MSIRVPCFGAKKNKDEWIQQDKLHNYEQAEPGSINRDKGIGVKFHPVHAHLFPPIARIIAPIGQ